MKAKISIKKITYPTYTLGEHEEMPMFLEARAYQGSSGVVYPYKIIDKIEGKKINKEYEAIVLENDYLEVTVLPELGGRIHRAYDKVLKKDFVYFNQVVKPALVGLTGPWISGGIEFNFPQHHRPSTHEGVEYEVIEEDGSVAVAVGEIDKMFGIKQTLFVRLFDDKAYIELNARIFNTSDFPETFLWWANPAFKAEGGHQSIFPPDVTAVFDHGKRDVTQFPITKGKYYKFDYNNNGKGTDISRYDNVPVPTSYMAYKSDYNFVGAYNHEEKFGLLHVADKHVSPGKKQWTWGNGNFGQVWDRNLTDEDGPYIELMTGVYTDNQPDFTWLAPHEEKTFYQYFMPYNTLGMIKNASKNGGIKCDIEENEIILGAYTTGNEKNVLLELIINDKVEFTKNISLSVGEVFENTISYKKSLIKNVIFRMTLPNEVIEYKDNLTVVKNVELPDPAKTPDHPENIKSNDELYFVGMHIEQYRNPSKKAEDYYLEALKRDEGDYRHNLAMGKLKLRRGMFEESIAYLNKAVKRQMMCNTNEYDGEALYMRGLAYELTHEYEKAYADFYKSTWAGNFKALGYLRLAMLANKSGDFDNAREFILKSLGTNGVDRDTRFVAAKLGAVSKEAVIKFIEQDPLDYALIYLTDKSAFKSLVRENKSIINNIAINLSRMGLIDDAIEILDEFKGNDLMCNYYFAYYSGKSIDDKKLSFTHFPNRLHDIEILDNVHTAKSLYLLGNFMYAKREYERAIKYWNESLSMEPHPTILRNLAMFEFNKKNNLAKAIELMEQSLKLDETNPRLVYELDFLYKQSNMEPLRRYEFLKKHIDQVNKRDDLFIEWIELHNLLNKYDESYKLVTLHDFHPWEGGEGKTSTAFITSSLGMFANLFSEKKYKEASELILKSQVYPDNINEGKLIGRTDNDILYLAALATKMTGDEMNAEALFKRASTGSNEVTEERYYYDQPAEFVFFQGLAKRQLGDNNGSIECFDKLIEFGEKNVNGNTTKDFFAVSQPNFNVFEERITDIRVWHCYYVMYLGYIGKGNVEKASQSLVKLNEICKNHNKIAIMSYLVKNIIIPTNL